MMEQMNNLALPEEPQAGRRPYVRPQMVVYGSLSDLTLNNSGSFTEMNGGMRMMNPDPSNPLDALEES